MGRGDCYIQEKVIANSFSLNITSWNVNLEIKIWIWWVENLELLKTVWKEPKIVNIMKALASINQIW